MSRTAAPVPLTNFREETLEREEIVDMASGNEFVNNLLIQLRAGCTRERELRIQEPEMELAEKDEEVREAYASHEKVLERLQRVQAEEQAARGRWHDLRYQAGDLRRSLSDVERELQAAKTEAREGTKRDASPEVRSVWQQNFGPDRDEDASAGDAKGMAGGWAPGNARVTNTPLSAGGDTPANNVVVPSEAIAAYQKGSKKNG